MASGQSVENNMSSIIANMSIAHEMIMNDDFYLTSVNDIPSSRLVLVLFFYLKVKTL